jgi:hypothetical protein
MLLLLLQSRSITRPKNDSIRDTYKDLFDKGKERSEVFCVKVLR